MFLSRSSLSRLTVAWLHLPSLRALVFVASLFWLCGTSRAQSVPASVQGLNVTGTDGQIVFTWYASSGATSYNVQRASGWNGVNPKVPAATDIVASGLTGTSYTDTNVTNGTIYAYQVTASNATGTSSRSYTIYCSPGATLAAPAYFELSLVTGVQVAWATAPQAVSYNIKRSNSASGPFTLVANRQGRTFFDTTISNTTTYYYVISAVDAGGNESANSSVRSITTGTIADSAYPTVAVTTPATNSRFTTVTTFPSVSGTAGDDVGVTTVQLRFAKAWAASWWNGTSWQGTYSNLATTLTGTGTGGATTSATWSCGAAMPSGTSLVAGRYTLQAFALDAAGHQTGSTACYIVIGSDSTAPLLTVTSPTANTIYGPSDTYPITGTVQEESGGSGLVGVTGTLVRIHQGVTQYWNGTAWGSSGSFFTSSTLSAPDQNGVVTWTAIPTFPPASQQESGALYLYVYANDQSGNSRNVTVTYYVTPEDHVVPTISMVGPTNFERLSSTGVSSASGTSGLGLSDLFKGQVHDDTGGSGIKEMRSTFTRNWSGATEYWNGTAWSTTYTNFNPAMTLVDAGGPGVGDDLYAWTLAPTLPSGANLPPGQYYAGATVYDRYNNIANAAAYFYINPSGGADSTAPIVAYTSPVSESIYNSGQVPTSLSGTVRDPNSGDGTLASGIGRMHARFCRNWNNVNQYWNGSVWSTTDTPYPVTFSAPDSNGQCTWSASSVPVPSGANLPSGRYFFMVVAVDRSGNSSSSYDYVRVTPNDTTAPQCALTGITSESVMGSLPTSYTGTAGDPNNPDGTVGSGVAQVQLRLLRNWDGATAEYWNGTAWSTTYAFFLATLSAPDANGNYTWTCSPTLPTGANSPSGRYQLSAAALDRYNNNASATPIYVRVGPNDITAPSLSFSFPSEGQSLSRLTQASGSATDPLNANDNNSAGTGVGRIAIQLRRTVTVGGAAQGQYWNGSAWTTTSAFLSPLAAGGTASETWVRNQGLPNGANLPPGAYILSGNARDRNGNEGAAVYRSFNIVANTYPSAQGQTVSVIKNTAQSLTLSASDAQGDAITAYRIVTAPQHGTLSGSGTNRIFTPTTGYVGADSFTFAASDWSGEGNAATVTLNIASSNHAPQAVAQSKGVTYKTATSITLSATDADGDAIASYRIVTQPEHGTLSGTAPNLTYTPDNEFVGADSFTFAASDWDDESAPAPVSLSVTGNTKPTASGTRQDVHYEVATPFTLHAIDADGDAIVSYRVVTQPAHGTLSGTVPNLTYTPNAGYSGDDSFTFAASDWQGEGNAATVMLSVAPPLPIDAMIAAGARTSYTSNSYAGDGVVRTEGGGYDSVINNGDVGTPIPFTVLLHKGVSSGDVIVTADAMSEGWSARYFYQGLDITQSVQGGGWTHTFALNEDAIVSLQVTPPFSAGVSGVPGFNSLVISARTTATGASGGADAVMALISSNPATHADLSLRLASETTYVGEGIHSTDGANQVKSTAIDVGPAQAFIIQVKNEGATAGSFLVKGAGSTAGWTIHYFDAQTGGNDITSQITGEGWTTPTLAGGTSRLIRAEVASGVHISGAQDFLVTVTYNSQVQDAVKMEGALPPGGLPQYIDKLQWSTDGGDTWTDLPASGSIQIMERTSFALKAIKGRPLQDWPDDPDILPEWIDGGHDNYKNVGEEVGILYETASGNSSYDVTASCHNSITAHIQVLPCDNANAEVELWAEDESLAVLDTGTGQAGTTKVTALVTDWLGQPLANQVVHFTTTAGQINGVGTTDDTATTNAQGYASVTLNAGAAGTASLGASIVIGNNPGTTITQTKTVEVNFQ